MKHRITNLVTRTDHIDLWQLFAEVTSGAAMQTFFDATHTFGHFCRQTTILNLDTVRHKVYLTPGSWNLNMLHFKTANCGICDLAVNEPTTGLQLYSASIDMYRVSGQGNFYHNASFTVVKEAPYQVVMVANGKNASSTSYAIPVTLIHLQRTGD